MLNLKNFDKTLKYIKNCQFGDGWVSGDRIGEAFK